MSDFLSINEYHAKKLVQEAAESCGELRRSIFDSAILLHLSQRRFAFQNLHDLLLVAFDDRCSNFHTHELKLFLTNLLASRVSGRADETTVAYLIHLLHQLRSDIFSLFIEERLGLGSAMEENAQKQGLLIQQVYDKILSRNDGSLTSEMILSLYEERALAAQILALFSKFCRLSVEDVVAVVEEGRGMIAEDPNLPLIAVSFTSAIDLLLADFIGYKTLQKSREDEGGRLQDGIPDFPPASSATSALVKDVKTLCAACQNLLQDAQQTTQWKCVGLYAFMSVQWALQLRRFCESIPEFEALGGVSGSNAELIVERAVSQLHLFPFIRRRLLPFASLDSDAAVTSRVCRGGEGSVFSLPNGMVTRVLVSGQIQSFCSEFLTRMGDCVRRMKSREEDSHSAPPPPYAVFVLI